MVAEIWASVISSFVDQLVALKTVYICEVICIHDLHDIHFFLLKPFRSQYIETDTTWTKMGRGIVPFALVRLLTAIENPFHDTAHCMSNVIKQ